MSSNPFRLLKSFVAFVALIVAASVPVVALVARAQSGDYDEARNRAQLEKIGRALQLYRADYGFVEPAGRNSLEDAGLPPNVAVLWQIEGKPWSLSRQDFVPATRRSPSSSTFSQMYWGPAKYASNGDLSTYYRTRGDRLIVLLDFESDPGLWKRADGMRDVMVLRLDGTVDRIRFDHDLWLDWANK